MHSLQKKTVAFLCLLIVAVPVLLSLKFILEQRIIMQEAEEKLHTEVLQSITVAKVDIVWVKVGKEILLGDELFDIKYTESKADSLIFTGFFDTQETALLAGFKKYTESNNSDNPLSDFTFKCIFSPVFNNYHKIVYETEWVTISNPYALFSEILPVAPCQQFIQPPRF